MTRKKTSEIIIIRYHDKKETIRRLNCLTVVKGVKKQHLPEKICQTCQRPFTWRKKWEKNWESVKYCSKKCSGKRKKV
jgi:hypothetical protein